MKSLNTFPNNTLTKIKKIILTYTVEAIPEFNNKILKRITKELYKFTIIEKSHAYSDFKESFLNEAEDFSYIVGDKKVMNLEDISFLCEKIKKTRIKQDLSLIFLKKRKS